MNIVYIRPLSTHRKLTRSAQPSPTNGFFSKEFGSRAGRAQPIWSSGLVPFLFFSYDARDVHHVHKQLSHIDNIRAFILITSPFLLFEPVWLDPANESYVGFYLYFAGIVAE